MQWIQTLPDTGLTTGYKGIQLGQRGGAVGGRVGGRVVKVRKGKTADRGDQGDIKL